MGEVRITEEAVRARLERWGVEFAFHRDLEPLGHKSKDVLQVLNEHRGEMPPRAQGYAPEFVDRMALEIEELVARVHAESPEIAWALRAFYCGRGRRGVERLQLCQALIRWSMGKERAMSRRMFYLMVDVGMHRVWGMLSERRPESRERAA